MAFVGAGPENVGPLEFAIFRRVAGVWKLEVRRSPEAPKLAIINGGIRETQALLRPTDPRCCPSGGTKTRTWRWNGHAFLGTAWAFHRRP